MASSKACVRRLQRELKQVQEQGISPTVHIAPRSNDITTIDALIIGPPDTPYDGAMFHFRIKVPPEYPLKPPQVRFMNTDGGTLRIHPQLYTDGKVCLSILGTWHGPKWTASQSVSTVLLSIQSLLDQEPLRCEPGLENAPKDAVDSANVFVRHEAMRVLILGNISGPGTPSWGRSEEVEPLTVAMHSHLRGRRSELLKRLAEMSAKHDKKVLCEPFVFAETSSRRRYDFAALLRRLQEQLPESTWIPSTPSSSSTARVRAPSVAPSKRPRLAREEERPLEAGDADGESAEAHCRICHQTAEESLEPLIIPCRCAGSIRHAHAKCILKWLEFSGQAVSSAYRCDICRAKFCVKLGRGKPIGYAYFKRDIDIFQDPDFESPGLVAAILISFGQTFTMTMGRGCAQIIHGCAVVICKPLPAWISGRLSLGLEVPVFLAELAGYMIYLSLLFFKAVVIYWGREWNPAAWGEFAEEFVESALGMADNLFALGYRLDSVIFLAVYFQVVHICTMFGGQSLLSMLLRWVLGSERTQHLWAFDIGLNELFPACRRLFPGTYPTLLQYIHFPIGLVSLLLNCFAIAGLFKTAFFDSRPMPVDILPASDCTRGVPRQPLPCNGALGAVADGEDCEVEDSKKRQ